MQSKRKIWFAVALTFFFLLVGTVGYAKLEAFSILDAFYMTVITISTVGFGEINQLSGVGRIFTIFLILSGVGSVAFAAHSFTESILERASNPLLKKKAMKKRISKLKGHCIICGHGRVGAAAAEHFTQREMDFVVIESSEEELEAIAERGYNVLSGDATSERVLLEAGIKNAGSLLALLNTDPENLFTVLTARELNPTLHIIARTEIATSESRMLRAGADAILSPYASAGRRVADKIMNKGQGELPTSGMQVITDNEAELKSIGENSELIGKEVDEAEQNLGLKIVGIRNENRDIILPDSARILKEGDQLLTVSSLKETLIEQKRLSGKIVLIDDNPVIRRLYTRLFQKAGYIIITEDNGGLGLDCIREEKPDVAVIDYMLPDISGLEVCRLIREDSTLDKTKLLLFTADEHETVHKQAVDLGVEKVVVKSPDASEIISIVQSILV